MQLVKKGCSLDYFSFYATKKARKYGLPEVEHTGLEPVTSTLPVWRAPNCANAPCTFFIITHVFINARKISSISYIYIFPF